MSAVFGSGMGAEWGNAYFFRAFHVKQLMTWQRKFSPYSADYSVHYAKILPLKSATK
jgi:hypothetical protein